MSFYIGDCSASSVRPSDVKNISHIRETSGLQDGDVVCVLGHVLRWSVEDCVSEGTCHS